MGHQPGSPSTNIPKSTRAINQAVDNHEPYSSAFPSAASYLRLAKIFSS